MTADASGGAGAPVGTSGFVRFDGTVDSIGGARALTVNTTGATSFNGVVGGISPLLTTNAGGTTCALSVTTTGAQAYNDAVTLNGTYTTTNSAFTAANTTTLARRHSRDFRQRCDHVYRCGERRANVDGEYDRQHQFSAAVGGVTPLTKFATDAGGTTLINGGAITTTGAQSYGEMSLWAPTPR